MSKKILLIGGSLVLVAVLVLVALGIWLGSAVVGKVGGSAVSPYSVVYLSNGGIYFGKLSWFPKPRISNPWTIQSGVDKDNKPQISVNPVSKSLWSPVDEIYLNKEQIIAWSRLRADGDMAKLLDSSQALQQQAPAQNPAPSQQPNDFKGPSTPPPAGK